MKITKSTLKRIIAEEFQHLKENWREGYRGRAEQLKKKEDDGSITASEKAELEELQSRSELFEDEEERIEIDEPEHEKIPQEWLNDPSLSDLPPEDNVDFPPEWEGKSYGYYVEPRLKRSEGPTYPGFPGGLQVPLQFKDKSGESVDFTEQDLRDYASFWGFEELGEGREERKARKSRMRASLGGGKKIYPRWWEWLNKMVGLGDVEENVKRIAKEEIQKMLKEKEKQSQ